jgi:dCTP deaminase
MILSDRDIRKSMQEPGGIRIEPLAEGAIQPASVDVRLGKVFQVFRDYALGKSGEPIDPSEPTQDDTERVAVFCLELQSQTMCLGSVLERVTVPDHLVCMVHGKSSIGRLGLCVHITAGLVDPGNTLNITLEIFNFRRRPILLRAGMKIAQLTFETLTSPVEVPYGPQRGSRYYGDTEAVPTKVHLNL